MTTSRAAKTERHVLSCVAFRDGWRPYPGSAAAAKRLAKRGLLKNCGFSVMPPHTLYVITEKGRAELAKHKEGLPHAD